jgi:hypothetical protein
MASLIKLGMTALLVLGVVVGNAGVGWAEAFVGCPPCTVKIDDLTETPTVLVTPVTLGIPTFAPDNNPAGEFLHFTFFAFEPGPPVFQPPLYSDLFEDHLGGTLSDRLVVTYNPISGLVDVKFGSDPATVAIPDGATHEPDFVENGDFQTLFSIAGPVSGQSVQFQVASDVDPVPAPATLFLVGAGLAGLGAVAWRRKRG